MKIYLINKDRKPVLLDGVTELVVHTEEGHAISLAVESQQKTVIASHAGEPGFNRHLQDLGLKQAAEKVLQKKV